MKVLVTGTAGFIGFHLTTHLLNAGLSVVGIDNLSGQNDRTLQQRRLGQNIRRERFSFRHVDIAEPEAVKQLFASERPEIVIHLAAQAGVRYSLSNPHAYTRNNIDGFLAVLEACRAHPVQHLIYASSSSVYGANSKVPFGEDDPVNSPVSIYAATKRSNELMAETYAHLFAVPCTGLRFFTVYGPWGRPDMAYFSFTKAIFENQTIDVYNHGRLERDFTYIDDIVEGVYRLMDQPPLTAAKILGLTLRCPHLLYNIGNHTPVPLAEFIAILESTIGRKAMQRHVGMQPGDVLSTFADVRRLAGVTGFQPATPLSVGLARFVEWYRSYYAQ